MPRNVDLPGSARPQKSDSRRLHAADPNQTVEVTIELRQPALPGPDAIPARALTRSEFASKYGASREDADKVTEVLKAYGLTVESVSLPTWSMRVSGPVSAMEAAFHPNLGIYHSREQGEFRGREGSLKIPIDLAGIVTGIFGLDQRKVARRRAAATAVRHALAPFGPADIEAHYGFPAGDAAGQTIAIAEFGGGYFDTDLSAYCEKFSRAVPNITIQPVNLKPLTLQQIKQLAPQDQNDELDASGEVMMDIQIVAGLCPAAKIVVYFATFDQKGWVDLLGEIVSGSGATPVSLSISWGAPEDSSDWSSSARDAINSRLNAISMMGITVCVSAGDDGSGDAAGDSRAHVDFPSASPFVLAVGGTMISGASSRISETAWWVSPGQRNGKGAGATGGGVSTLIPRPAWQNVHVPSVNQGSIDGRVVPDVAALSGAPGFDLIFLGQDSPNGGTSASAPLWASLIARLNALLPAAKRQRFLTPLLYQNGPNGKPLGETVCVDITTGQNASHPQPGIGYKAGPGFDAVTGWGVPDGKALLSSL